VAVASDDCAETNGTAVMKAASKTRLARAEAADIRWFPLFTGGQSVFADASWPAAGCGTE
jgi:hypothetical protein